MKRKALSARQHVAALALSDGSDWRIFPSEERTSSLISRLAATMQLSLVKCPTPPNEPAETRSPSCRHLNCLCVLVEGHEADHLCDGGSSNDNTIDEREGPVSGSYMPPLSISYTAFPNADEEIITCILTPVRSDPASVQQLVQISLVIAQHAQHRGGILLHGALAEKGGYGVVLAGPGEAGKTTASQRLPPPWRSLCDDSTLVVCDDQGVYWGHPWPTWSNFMFGGAGGTWNVQQSVRLNAIFFLRQAQEERFEPLGTAKAVCLLTESAEQAFRPLLRSMEKYEVRTARLRLFDNICALAQSIPCYLLHLSRAGAFWEKIEQALNI